MFQSLSTLCLTIWESLDDILICLSVFLLLRVIASWCYWCCFSYFKCDEYISGLVEFVFLGTLSIFVLTHLFGPGVALSLFSGFSVGMGYAFQPYIISFFTGFWTRQFIKKGDRLFLNQKIVVVDHISILYICVRIDNMKSYITHSQFQSTPLTKIS